MRRVLLSLLILLLVRPALGQDGPVPDTLDWRLYYPLEIGNVWEWETYIIVAYHGFDRREIVADTVINGRTYYVQAEYQSDDDPNWGGFRSRTDTTFLRYDTDRSRVVALPNDDPVEYDYTCDLSLISGPTEPCGESWDRVDLYYPDEHAFLSIQGDSLPYTAVKYFYNIGGGVMYYHGVGMLPDIGDGNAGTIGFSYVRVGSEAYGERRVIVAVEDAPPAPSAALSVYPNPAVDRLTVAYAGATERWDAGVYDGLGREVLTVPACSAKTCDMDVSGLGAGVYFIRVAGRRGTSSRSFVIAR